MIFLKSVHLMLFIEMLSLSMSISLFVCGTLRVLVFHCLSASNTNVFILYVYKSEKERHFSCQGKFGHFLTY